MDTLIISNENNILHVFNKGYSVDYTIYDSKGHSLDGGVLESNKEKFETDFAIKEVISIVKENFEFNTPYMYLQGERAETLLEMIQEEDYENIKKKINELHSSKEDREEEIEK